MQTSNGFKLTHFEISIILVEEHAVTSEQKDEMLRLQVACFSDQVTADELEEDFDRPPIARVFAYHQDELVACAEVFKRQVTFIGQSIYLGGFGPCTRKDYRNLGIGTRVCRAAMRYLIDQGCDIGFLSVDTGRENHPLYDRLGFKMLPKPFIYANSHGELKESDGGMIVPLCSQTIFEYVLQGHAQLDLTPEAGYW